MSDFKVGDIIQLHGPHPSLPPEFEEKYWRVKAVSDGSVELDGPYNDYALTVRYKRMDHIHK